MDERRDGMLIAMIVHPPAFDIKLKSVDDSEARAMPGIRVVFIIKTFEDGHERNYFDTNTFSELVAVVGNSTWEVMQAKEALDIEWEGHAIGHVEGSLERQLQVTFVSYPNSRSTLSTTTSVEPRAARPPDRD